jgi:uncharacterized protein (TIRG00374 family)
MRAPLRRFLVWIIALAVVGVLVYRSRRAIHLGNFNLSKLGHAIREANIPLLLLCVAVIFICYAIRALRWQRFCKYLGPTTFKNTYTGTLMGFAAVFVLGRAGEPVRPLLLARKERLPAAGLFGIYVLERLFDFAAAFALAILSLLVFPGRLADAGANSDWLDSARTGGWFLVGGLTVLIGLPLYYRLHGASMLDKTIVRWRTAGGWRQRFAGGIGGFSEGLQAIRTIPDLGLAVFYTAAHWGLVALIYFWIGHAFSNAFTQSDLNFPCAMLLLAITLVGSTLQLPGVGGGAQIASIIALTTIFGVEQEPATAIAIVIWLISFASCTLIGIPLLIHEGLSMGELRQLARAEAKAEEVGTHLPSAEIRAPKSPGAGNKRDSTK